MAFSIPKASPFSSLDKIVVKVSKVPLHKVAEHDFADFAMAVWFDTKTAKARIQKRLETPSIPPVRKRRLLYLVDRLRRFPCLDDHDAESLKQFVSGWQKLLGTAGSGRRTGSKTKDKLAKAWGVNEDASRLFSCILEFQTRHYVDEHGLRSGYATD